MDSSALLPPALEPLDRADRLDRLQRSLGAEEPLLLPGVTDALTAIIAEDVGYDACYATGAGASNAHWGWPDLGMVSLVEVGEYVSRIAHATALPVVADADNGYGGPALVARTIRTLEDAGAVAIQLEDQAIPKRCGHFDGKTIVGPEEMVTRILAARQARRDGTLIIARTDARAVEGFDAAIRRARIYRAAGADILFVEAPENHDEVERIPQLLPDVPLVINVVDGGRTPVLPVADLAGMGYKIILYANHVLRTMMMAAQTLLRDLHAHGDSSRVAGRMAEWSERQRLVNLAAFDRFEDELRAQAEDVVRAPVAQERSSP